VLNVVKRIREDDLGFILFISGKLEADEVIFERTVSIVFSEENLIWLWIGIILVSLDEINILVD
jgi:hypothetical protein